MLLLLLLEWKILCVVPYGLVVVIAAAAATFLSCRSSATAVVGGSVGRRWEILLVFMDRIPIHHQGTLSIRHSHTACEAT